MFVTPRNKMPKKASVPLRKRINSLRKPNFFTDSDDDSFGGSDYSLNQEMSLPEKQNNVTESNASHSDSVQTISDSDDDASVHKHDNVSDGVDEVAVELFEQFDESEVTEAQFCAQTPAKNVSEPGEDSGEIGLNNRFLKRLERKQVGLLKALAERRTPRAIRKMSRRNKSNASGSEFQTVDDHWEAYLDCLPKKFFRSSEARLEDDLPSDTNNSDSKQMKRPYQGLVLTPKNNSDLLRIYELFWKCRDDLGQSMGTFDQFRTVIGQYARFSVAVQLCTAKVVSKPGMLCRILCSIKAVEAFIRGFQIRSSAGTVMNKAVHLARLARYADSYFAERNESEKCGHIRCIVEYLNGVARCNKNECRRQATVRKDEELRLGSNVYLTSSDIEYFAESSLDVTDEIINTCRPLFREKNRHGVIDFLSTTKDLLRKWNLNFLVSLMFHGGGQRPQVYTILEAPSAVDFVSLREQAMKTGAFFLRISYEKRIRCVDLPSVLFPAAVFRAVKFHVQFVLPCLYAKLEIEESDPRRNCLLIHTETGSPLSSRQVTTSVRSFLKRFDPELEKVSAMTLRASYASMMLEKHRRGETLGRMNEDKFLDYLAKIMNTSREQLKETYISTSTDSFENCATILAGIMDKESSPEKRNEVSLDLFDM